jgi:hypothetical protein
MNAPRLKKTKLRLLCAAVFFWGVIFSVHGQGLLREYWSNINGTTVASLTGNSNYPNNPTSRGTITSFEGPSAVGDNYGSRIRGYIVPPTTGSYTFWIASDDNSELYLSTSADPLAKTLIASVSDWTNSREWTKNASQQSSARTLTAGQKYYIEVLHKNGTMVDHIAVGWQGPGITGDAERPIPGTRLVPYEVFYKLNAGSTSAAAPFTVDQFASGGTPRTITNTIDMSGVTDPAPQAVYQSERYGTSTYTFPNLTASANYKIRLHFAELFHSTNGGRIFNVSINGSAVLSNFDVYASAGAMYKAIVREFQATANSSGQIVVAFNTVTDNATISGIEILPNSVVNNAPTVATAAAVSPNPVIATTASLSVLGTDDAGESNLTYTWATTGTPPATVSFSANGTNAAKSVTATFTRAGSYTLQATIRDQGNLTATNTVTFTVNQTLTSVTITPATATINNGATQQYTATGNDQFGTVLTTQPTWNWTTNGGGAISSSGLLTGTTAGSYTITVTSDVGNITSNAAITINAAPVISAQPSSQTVNSGASVTFTVTATGTPAPTYQWKKNEINISGATNASYSISSVQASDEGSYKVTVTNSIGSVTSDAAILTFTNNAPTVATAASANPTNITGATTALTVLGADDAGEPNLKYEWSTTGTPPATVSFSDNNTNAAKATTATFIKAGIYYIRATITDVQGLYIRSDVTVTVSQTLTTITVTPTNASIAINTQQQFYATGLDQFSAAMITQPTFDWYADAGGTISSSGLFTAGSTAGGPYIVTAKFGETAIKTSVQLTVTNTNVVYEYPNVCGENENMKVDGQIKCNSLLIYNWLLSQKGAQTAAPDYVFQKSYDLKSLKEINEYIKNNGHLPEVPSAKELETSGVDMIQLNFVLLKKIEELTLHLIRQDEKIEALEKAKGTEGFNKKVNSK